MTWGDVVEFLRALAVLVGILLTTELSALDRFCISFKSSFYGSKVEEKKKFRGI